MRIPVFRSRAQATSEAPGARITARMDAGPLIRAELAKGEAFKAATDEISKFALKRLEEEADIQYQEGLIAAEEQMRELREKYKNASRLGDVINEDGTGAWQQDMAEIRDRLSEGMIGRTARNAFTARFNQQELAYRFQLRDDIQRRIQARSAAALKARQESLVAQLSDHRASLQLLPMLLASNDAELASRVQSGRITPEMRATVNQKIIGDIADGATMSLVGSDPTMALKLARALEYQDMVDRGEMTAEDAALRAGLPEDAAYTLAVLQLAPRDKALASLGKAATNAVKLDQILDEISAENEKLENDANTAAYNSAFGVDPNAPASTDLSERLSAGALRLIGKQPGEAITGQEYLRATISYLDQRNAITPEQRTKLQNHLNPEITGPFVKQSDPGVFANLLVRKNSGTLTIQELNQNQGALSLADYKDLASGVFGEADQSLQFVDDQIAAQFKYNKLAGANDEISRMAEQSYANASSRLQSEYNKRRAAGNPMTSTELNALGVQLVNEERTKFVTTMQENLTQYIGALSSKGIPALTTGNELQDLDAWYNSLVNPNQSQQRIYTQVRTEIARRIRMMQGQ